MLTEFASIQFTREELLELHAALLQRAMVEDELRKERGQERTDQFPLLEKIERLVGENPQWLLACDAKLEDDLWEYAWFVFTDEWAWFRAEQDAERDASKGEDAKDKKQRLERLYRERFDAYVAEVDMHDTKKKTFVRAKEQKKG
jgi:hypothetical protein